VSEQGRGEIAEHEPCADADDAEARALQLAIAASVGAGLARVIGPSTSTMSLMLDANKSAMKSPATGTWRRNETPSAGRRHRSGRQT